MMKQFLLIIFCFAIPTLLMAQTYDPAKVNPKARALYDASYEEVVNGNMSRAMLMLNEAIDTDPGFVEGYLSRAGLFQRQRNYQQAVSDYHRAFTIDSLFAKTYAMSYATSLAGLGRFGEALAKANQYLQDTKISNNSRKAAETKKTQFEFAVQMQQQNSNKASVISPVSMGESINTKYLEYYPSFTIDGKKIVFTRRMSNEEDFYESELVNGSWTKSIPLRGHINTTFNEGAQNISADGKWLVYAGCDYPGGYGSCDLYIAKLEGNGQWSQPENLGNIVNSEFWDSAPVLSADKKDLYFVSNRPGGYGGMDIYVSHYQPNGTWSKPQNLGPTINTKADDQSPFIHADNETLFFSSTGWPGYGSRDIYYSKKDSNGNWQQPINLGYPVNTIDDEGALVVALDGKTAYYAAEVKLSNGLDIFSFSLPDSGIAKRTTWVKGKVFDKKTGEPLTASVDLSRVSKKGMQTNILADKTGEFLVTLPLGEVYALNVNKKGYLFYSDNFSLDKNLSDSSYQLNIPLQPIEKGASIVLKNIFFDSKKAELKPQSIFELDKVAALMLENATVNIEIGGHTDNVGQPKDNLAISNSRAKSVVDYLVKKGVAASRLKAKGYGETKPIAPNNSEAGRAANRRTVLVIAG